MKSLSIGNLVTNGKTLNLTITLSEYDPNKTSIVEKDKIKMDFTGLSPLISDLYNTAKLKTYHLTAKDVGLSFPKIKLDLDFHLFVDGNIVKVYGKINAPSKLAITSGFKVGYSYRNSVFYFDDINPETGKAFEDNSGYAYLSYGLAKNKNDFSENVNGGHYKYHSSYFQETEGIIHFIFKDIINITDLIYNQIESNITKEDTSGKAINYEKLISAFTYDETNRKWDMGLAVQVLLNSNTLKDLTAKISSSYSETNNCYLLSEFDISLKLISIISISGTIKNIDLDKKDNWIEINDLYTNYIQAHINDKVDYPSGYGA